MTFSRNAVINDFKAYRQSLSKQLRPKRKPHKTRDAHIDALQQQVAQQALITKQPVEKVQVHGNTRQFRTIGVICVIAGYFIFQSLNFVYLIITAFIIAMAIENLILYFQRWCKRGLAIGIAYILFIIFIISGVVLVVPFVVWQIVELVNSVIDQIALFQQTIQDNGLAVVIADSGLPGSIKSWLLDSMQEQSRVVSLQQWIVNNISQIVSVWGSSLKDAWSIAVSIVTWFFAWIFQVSLVFVCAIFFSIEKENVIHFLSNVSTNAIRTELVVLKLYRKLGNRLQGQLILCLAVGILTGIWLTIVGWIGINIPNKFSLALIAWLTEFIPYLGPFLGMLPALLVAWISHGFWGIVAILLLYRVIQQTENNVLVPTVMYHTLGVSPLLIFICMVVGGSILGFLWVLLAVPLAVIISILYEGYAKAQPFADDVE